MDSTLCWKDSCVSAMSPGHSRAGGGMRNGGSSRITSHMLGGMGGKRALESSGTCPGFTCVTVVQYMANSMDNRGSCILNKGPSPMA